MSFNTKSRLPPSTTKSQIYTAIWNEVEAQELGLYIGVEEGTARDTTRTELTNSRPFHLGDYVVSAVAGAIFILKPGVDLDEHLG